MTSTTKQMRPNRKGGGPCKWLAGHDELFHSSDCIGIHCIGTLVSTASHGWLVEVRRQTNQPLLKEIIEARRLTLFRHVARMDDNVDAKQILTSSPSVYWKRPPGRPRMTWMKRVQNDLDSHGLSWTDAVDLAQNRPLSRLLATSGATYS